MDQQIKRYVDEPPINPYVETFFSSYASISPTELRQHLIHVRENAWKNFDYHCLGRWTFLDFSIRQSPIYNEIVDKCKNDGATVIDFGCCLGQDIRQLAYDGVPLEQIRGYELDPFFIQQGYELFRDENPMKEKKVFHSADIFDDKLLETIEPADYVHVGSFIHLFDFETQKDVCRRLARLSKNAIIGRQSGSEVAEEHSRHRRSNENSKRMRHSPESFRDMWNEVTNGQWQVEYANLKTIDDGDRVRVMLSFVVRNTKL